MVRNIFGIVRVFYTVKTDGPLLLLKILRNSMLALGH